MGAHLADDPDFESIIIDGTIIRAHQHAAGGKGGFGRGDRTLARGLEHENSHRSAALTNGFKIEDNLFDAALRLIGTYVRMHPYDGETRQRLTELMGRYW